ncbi:MAG: DNA polymerase Y family protein [Nitratireductor sp.]|nr:DNA polymerase Y family protein [Nitratireductor sp.]
MWFPRLATDRVLRACPVEAPFVLTLKQNNTDKLYCLNTCAERAGLHRGMRFADARAFCPDLVSRPARPEQDARFQAALRRWATRYCPWVGREGEDGLVLDVTGSTHLFGGEEAMLDDMRQRAERAGLALRLGLAGTRGAAWALAHFEEGIAAPDELRQALKDLPVAALRLDAETDTALQRLGLRTIGNLAAAARAPLARRFGQDLITRLDRAMGDYPETVAPEADPPHYGVRLTLPEPVGLVSDVMAGASRLLDALCARLRENEAGARILCLTLRRVDQGSHQIELRLAAAMRDPARILRLFERGISEVDAGFGIDRMRLEAILVEPLPVEQISITARARANGLDDLITRIGTRIGLENIQRFLPVDSHIPEHGFVLAPAAHSAPGGGWISSRPRPIRLFEPEPVIGPVTSSTTGEGAGTFPPERFSWRRMVFNTARSTGPERIAPEWWIDNDHWRPHWRSGVRDYWRVETRQGRRLWLFFTPQSPRWFVQGEFA